MAAQSASCCVAEPEESPATPVQDTPSNNQGTQQDYDFVEEPDQDCFCPVSLELLLYPYLTSCCGHHVSQQAGNRLVKEGKPCPMCKEEGFSIQVDKYFKRKTINKLKVRCPHKRSGCEWVGELGDLNRHSTSCPKRPWKCQYCDFESTYEIETGTNDHTPNCAKYPLPCPNQCEIGTVPRCDAEKHLLVCPLQLVECEFAHAGCDVKIPRRDLAKHMTENVQHHLMSATLLNLRLTRELHQKMEDKDQQIAELKQQVAGVQKKTSGDLRTKLQQDIDTKLQRQTKDIDTKLQQQTRDIDTKLRQQTKDIDTKLQQQTRDIDTKLQQDEDIDTKLQQQTRDIDTKLRQQTRDIGTKLQQQTKDIDTKLLQQTTNIGAKFHQQTTEIDTKLQHQTEDIGTGLHQQTKEIDTKLQHQTKDIGTGLQQQTEDIDTKLQHQTKEINTKLRQQTREMDQKITALGRKFGCTYHEFTMADCKADGRPWDWYSDPFLSSPGGYTFKLNIDKYAGYLRAFLDLLEGDHDKELKWPAKVTVHLEMLNQRGDHDHHTTSATVEYKKPAIYQEYVDIDNKFYSIANLNYNAERDPEYLKDGCMKFVLWLRVQ